jgi:hypothetical protein
VPLVNHSGPHRLNVVDETFIVADPVRIRAATCDPARWSGWLPGTVLTTYDDRGPLGARWTLTGALVGTAEIWLEAHGDGTIVHAYLRANPGPGDRAAHGRRRGVDPPALVLRRGMFELKDLLEGDRAPGTTRVPLSERVVSASERRPISTSMEGEPGMADQTTSSILIAADPASIMDVIADFDSYPAWAKGVTATEVLSEYDDGRAGEVAFVLDAAPIKDEYTLAYEWEGNAQVTWSLVKARMLKSMAGAYILSPQGDSTEVTYQLQVDLAIPMIGMLKRKGERVIIDTALKGLKRRVESLA